VVDLNTLPRVSKIMMLLGLNYTTCDSLFHYVRISMEQGSLEGRGDMDVHCQSVKDGVGRRWSDQHNVELQQIRLTPTRLRWWYVESTWKFATLLGVLRGIFFLYPGISFLSVCTYV
jgi:hypothetical protein